MKKVKKEWIAREIELVYVKKEEIFEEIKSSKDCEMILRKIWSSNIEIMEEFYIILLNKRNMVIGYYYLSKGGISSVVVDLRIVFMVALKSLASSIILAHNHPSNYLGPSEEDKRITLKLVKAGELLEIKVLDHLILTSSGFYSFSDQGLI